MQTMSPAPPYGYLPGQPQPNNTGMPSHTPGTPEPTVRTQPAVSPKAPVLLIVALMAAAVLLTQFTVRGSVEVGG